MFLFSLRYVGITDTSTVGIGTVMIFVADQFPELSLIIQFLLCLVDPNPFNIKSMDRKV